MSTDHNTDDPRFEMLARASQSITVTPLDAAHVVDVARTRRRRRRTAVGSALAVAVVIAGMSVATAGSDPVLKKSIDAADTTKGPEPLPFPAPPEGMKWVGQNGLVVAVPAEWPVTENNCGSGAPAEVVDGAYAATIDCPSPRGKAARVTLTSLTDDPEPPIQGSCTEPAINPTCYAGEIFSEQKIAVQVSVTGDDAAEQVSQILDSAMVLPQGWTTVPFAGFSNTPKRVDLLEAAGFKVEVDEGARGQFVEVSPEFGSPVQEGSTITLSPVSGTSVEPTSPTLEELTLIDGLDECLLDNGIVRKITEGGYERLVPVDRDDAAPKKQALKKTRAECSTAVTRVLTETVYEAREAAGKDRAKFERLFASRLSELRSDESSWNDVVQDIDRERAREIRR